MQLPRRVIYLIVALCIVGMLGLADEYPAMRFRGDAKFSGGPINGYRITMRSIPLAQAGEYAFRFSGLPTQQMSLLLHLDPKTSPSGQALTHLGTTISATLVDRGGHALCQATGALHDGPNEPWLLTFGPSGEAFSHWNCIQLHLRPSETYTLTLRISKVDPQTPKINLVPTIESGGLDLP